MKKIVCKILMSAWLSTLCLQAVTGRAQSSTNLVQNGGFELASLADWTLTGAGDAWVTTSSFYMHSGFYGTQLGPVGALGYLSQSIPTSAGQQYLISCWLHGDGGIPNEFLVSWNGVTLFNGVNIPAGGWTNLLFTAPATGLNTILELGFRDDPSYLGLDDIGVFPTSPYAPPAFYGIRMAGSNLFFSWSGINGVNYQVQYRTNLNQTNWLNLGALMTGTNSIMTFTDNTSTNKQRYYHLVLIP